MSRNNIKYDVDHIVTEYGIAKLRGKSISQRIQELINVAHPKFCDKLTYEAKRLGFIV
ncbi:acetyl-CoA hydrolase/transferase C-terminal domain-containing protein [Gottfriedia sp. NPDC057948]|uniref:acetyl-CoA hydrolase/transferase C-terminal domain-containing protein n=1 Tax=Gottfriedia sp. NPDC057948 TaxID=3346287 RepID=UPI0036DED778